MDFDEMRAAYQRAMGVNLQPVQTSAAGGHVPTVVVQTPAPRSAQDLVRRLTEQHLVRWEPICEEAANALEYTIEQNQINLSKLDAAIEIMRDLYSALEWIKQETDGWPWEIRGFDVEGRVEDAMRRYLAFNRD